MRIGILAFFLLCYFGLYFEAQTQEAFKPLSGLIYPFKEMNGGLSLKPVTTETISPPMEVKEPPTTEVKEKEKAVKARVAAALKTTAPQPPKGKTEDKVEAKAAAEPPPVKPIEVPPAVPPTPDAASKPFDLERHIKNSNSTYFFTDIQATLKDVSVSLLSITPYGDKDILKFSVRNDQKDFFFISNITIKKDDKIISPELFYEPLAKPGSEMTCLAVLPRMNRSLSSLALVESGGKARIFNLKFFVQ